MLDRIDLQIEVAALAPEEITSTTAAAPSSAIRARVEAARAIQRECFRRSATRSNGEMTSRHMRRACELDAPSRRLLDNASPASASPPAPPTASSKTPARSPTWQAARQSTRRT